MYSLPFNFFCRKITACYTDVKTTLQKKDVGFYLEACLIGIPCELTYREGVLYELKTGAHVSSLGSVLLNHIKDSGLNGIPLRLDMGMDATVKGIITLNKRKLFQYIADNDYLHYLFYYQPLNDLNECIPDDIFFKNLMNLLDLKREWNNPWYEDDDYCRDMTFYFIKLMYDAPSFTGWIMPKYEEFLLTHNVQRSYLFEFIVFDSDFNILPNDFIFYDKKIYCKEEAKICNIVYESNKKRKNVKKLNEILKLVRALAADELEFLYLNDWYFSPDEVDKKELIKKGAKFKKGMRFHLNIQPEKNNLNLQILNTALKNYESIDNAITNYLKIPLFFVENNSVLGNLGETLTDIRLILSEWIPIKKIEVNKSSNIHGIDHVYETINPKTYKKQWLIGESKVNSSNLSNGQCTEEWIMKNLFNAVDDPEKATEIITEYKNDYTCVKVYCFKLEVTQWEREVKNLLFKTTIPIHITELNHSADAIRKTDIEGRISQKLFSQAEAEKFKRFITPWEWG